MKILIQDSRDPAPDRFVCIVSSDDEPRFCVTTKGPDKAAAVAEAREAIKAVINDLQSVSADLGNV